MILLEIMFSEFTNLWELSVFVRSSETVLYYIEIKILLNLARRQWKNSRLCNFLTRNNNRKLNERQRLETLESSECQIVTQFVCFNAHTRTIYSALTKENLSAVETTCCHLNEPQEKLRCLPRERQLNCFIF